ncbi:Lrp/AsnC family transcriptional regulator [Phenylobacterium sp.]|uniref:Lrp/AsnC family transcriptional regulator n=1 Tax=Phenylobacterium sp. TaxID=1871053 RepID=UPI002896832C|nr:Lrp/AsnC family transcriptional regulator [Phenylobacterium sp.]
MTQTTAPRLDRTDRRILAALAADGRLSWRDLAAQVGLSLTPVMRRVRRLETEGFITGYAARFDERRLGAAFSVFVQVSLERQAEEALETFESRIAQAPEIMSCYLMSGDADYLLRVVAADLESYQAFMTGFLTRIPGVARIQSSFALKPVIDRTAPPLG